MPFSAVPYIFQPSTAASPQLIKSAEVNLNFACLTQVVVNTAGGHFHNGIDSRLLGWSGIARVCTADGITAINFSASIDPGFSFSTVASLIKTANLTATNLIPTTAPWTWNNAGFTMTLVYGNVPGSVAYDGSARQAFVSWISSPFSMS